MSFAFVSCTNISSSRLSSSSKASNPDMFLENVQLPKGSNFSDRDSGSRRIVLNAWYKDALSASPALNLCDNLFSESHVEFVGLYKRGMCPSPWLLPKTKLSFPEIIYNFYLYYAFSKNLQFDDLTLLLLLIVFRNSSES